MMRTLCESELASRRDGRELYASNCSRHDTCMSLAESAPCASLSSPALPTRFREAEERGVRLGRPLRLMARIGKVDEAVMASIGDQMLACDPVGASLAQAMRLPAGHPRRVSMADFQQALRDGLASIADPAPALTEFFAAVEDTPGWVDWELVERGARVYHRLGQNAVDVLLQLSLIGGYRFGGPPDLLVATGGLTGDTTRRRLAETQMWGAALAVPDSLRREGEAWRLTVHVRAMHALVNQAFEPRWDVERWGVPISQADQGATLGLFDGVVLLGVRALGVPVSRADSRAYMHLWKYVGWLMGVDEEWLVDSERKRHRLNYHMLLAQADVSEAGPKLAQAIVKVQTELNIGRFGWVRGRFARERLLSMLTTFLGPQSMRDLGLPIRPPWAPAYVLALNTWRYRIYGRTPWGRRALDRWAQRSRDAVLNRYFGVEQQEVGALK